MTSSKDRGLCQYLLAECEKSQNQELSFLKRLCKAKRAEYVLRRQTVTATAPATATAAVASESHVRLKWPLLQLRRQLLRLEMRRVTVLRRLCAKQGFLAWCLIWFRSAYIVAFTYRHQDRAASGAVPQKADVTAASSPHPASPVATHAEGEIMQESRGTDGPGFAMSNEGCAADPPGDSGLTAQGVNSTPSKRASRALESPSKHGAPVRRVRRKSGAVAQQIYAGFVGPMSVTKLMAMMTLMLSFCCVTASRQHGVACNCNRKT